MKELHNPFFLGDQPGGTQVSGWLDAWTPAPSIYAVKAETAAHVAAAVKFARTNNLRLVVKGTGHSYLGTSSAPDSLLVWTRAMNTVNLHDAFVLNGGEGKVAGQRLTREDAKKLWRPFFDFVRAAPTDFEITDELGAGAHDSREWWKVPGNDSMIADDRSGAPSWHGWWQGDQGQVGAFLHGYESLWLPAVLLAVDRRSQFAEALFRASRYKQVSFHCNKGLAGGSPEAIAAAKETATNPNVCHAFALAIIADGEKPAYPGLPGASVDFPAAHKDARAIAAAAAELYRLVPDAGSYVSESNYFNPRWQNAYWGENYQRLRAVKNKYDPDGLFTVHHGVGSEDWSPDGFTRVS